MTAREKRGGGPVVALVGNEGGGLGRTAFRVEGEVLAVELGGGVEDDGRAALLLQVGDQLAEVAVLLGDGPRADVVALRGGLRDLDDVLHCDLNAGAYDS